MAGDLGSNDYFPAGDANGQFVCSGAESLDLQGFGWTLDSSSSSMDSNLQAAYEAQNIDVSSLTGYTFSNSEGKEVTIWSDSDSQNISFNDADI